MKRIAFIKCGPFSHTNMSILRTLKKYFNDCEIDTLDVKDLIIKEKKIILINIFHIIKEYGTDILLFKKNARNCFFRTSYIFRKIKALLSSYLLKNKYLFSFQTQSLFDASREGLPHFVYTDHTALTNLHYPNIDKRTLFLSTSGIDLEKTIYHNATRIFTMSTNISKSLIEEYSCAPDKVVCVYAGSNAEMNNMVLNNDKYLSKNILFVGVNWQRKGGPVLLEAFEKVLEVHQEARLTIVGCSPRIDVPNCHVVGRVPLEEVQEYYEKASVFCLPTRLEPFGIVFIEALYHKLPVVATNIGAIPDFVVNEENGYLVKPNDVDQLAKLLIELIGNPQKCKILGEKGYRIVSEKYSWEKTGSMIKQSIESAIGKYIT